MDLLYSDARLHANEIIPNEDFMSTYMTNSDLVFTCVAAYIQNGLYHSQVTFTDSPKHHNDC